MHTCIYIYTYIYIHIYRVHPGGYILRWACPLHFKPLRARRRAPFAWLRGALCAYLIRLEFPTIETTKLLVKTRSGT